MNPMLELRDLRQHVISQEYHLEEIEAKTSMSDIRIRTAYSYSDLLVVEPEDLTWQNCQYDGFGGYGIFEVAVCVANEGWNAEAPFQYKTAHVLVMGRSIQDIQQRAAKWFLDNRDLKNPLYKHRFGREFTPVLYKMKHYKAFVPKD
jgi:hypothetical protein